MNTNFKEIRIMPENAIPESEFASSSREPYNFHKGRLVEFCSQGGSFIGVYQGLRNEDLVLQPFLAHQTHFSP
ncbi:MAG: hypothetical protein AABX07_02020 [Nanoarchaeota archaeon]